MHVSQLHVERFRSFLEESSISGIGPVAAFIGRNNAGKSNVFRAVSLATVGMSVQAGSAESNPWMDDVAGGHLDVSSQATVVSLGVDLTPAEWEAVPRVQNEPVKPHVRTVTWSVALSKAFSGGQENYQLTGNLSANRRSEYPSKLSEYLRPRVIHVPTDRRIEQETIGDPARNVDDRFDGRKIKRWLNEFSAGRTEQAQSAYAAFLSDLHSVSGFESVELTLAASGTIDLFISERPGSFRVPLEQAGAGLQMVIVVLAALHQQPGRVVMVDDPESGLHPSAQESFARVVAERAVVSGSQILFATHSPSVLEAVPDDQVFEVHRQHGHSVLRAVGPEGSHLVGLLRDLGYRPGLLRMAEAILFVEGPSDDAVIRAWWKTLFDEVMEPYVAIVALGGQNYQHLSTEAVTSLGHRAFMLLDSDRASKEMPPSQKALDFRDQMADVVNVHILERRSIENYYSSSAISRVIGVDCPEVGPWSTLAEVGIEYSKRHHPAAIAATMSREEIPDEIVEFLTEVRAASRPLRV